MGKKQTAVEWLSNQTYELFEQYSEGNFDRIQLNKLIVHATNQAKEMEKQQIIDAAERWKGTDFAEKYYAENYGSKRSDEPNGKKVLSALKEFRDSLTEEEKENMFKVSDEHIVDTNEMVSSQTEISDESWEGCDGCTEQDEVMYKNGYVKGYNAAIGELPKEISDDEIGKGCDENIPLDEVDMWSERLYFRIGAQWYREQLKNKL